MAARELPMLLYGPNHPYGGTQLGSPTAVKGFTRAQLLAFKDRWLRPDNAELFVVSDLPLAELKPQLEAAFADLARAGGSALAPRLQRADAPRRPVPESCSSTVRAPRSR